MVIHYFSSLSMLDIYINGYEESKERGMGCVSQLPMGGTTAKMPSKKSVGLECFSVWLVITM